MRGLSAPLLVLALLLPGCLGGPEPAAEDVAAAAANRSVEIGDRPETTFTEVATGPAAAPDEEATLERAPALVPGEWWRIKIRSPLSGAEAEFVRVVADVIDGVYVFGMPHEGWYKEAVLYHTPAFGDVAMEDLSYPTHNILFQPLKFPLTDDQTWETQFSGGPPMTAAVSTDPAAKTATVTFANSANGNQILTLVYDARMHEVVSFKHSTIEYEVLEHGYGYEGWVTVPRGEELVFLHGRIAGVLAPGAPQPNVNPVPVESVEVAGGFNRMTFFQATFPITASGPHPGVFRTVATAPDGTVFETMSTPADTGFKMAIFEFANPDGTWTLEHEAAGPGVAFIEGIAYHQYDIRLPDGARRSDHSHEVVR